MTTERDDEDLKQLGSAFKAAREAKGLSLKDVNDKTRVSATVLDAIENGSLHLLPPGVYARNFIRTYADFLNIDSQPLLELIQKQNEQPAPPILQKENSGPSITSYARRWKFLALGAAVLILAGSLIWFLISCWNPGQSTDITAESRNEAGKTGTSETLPAGSGVALQNNVILPPSPETQVQMGTTPISNPGSGNPQTAFPPEAVASTPSDVNAIGNPEDSLKKEPVNTAGPYHLTIEAKDRTWLRLQADDGEKSQYMMKSGERINRTAQRHFLLDIGNAAGVDLSFQGRKMNLPGKQGQVIHLNLP